MPEGSEIAVTAEQVSALITNSKLIEAECFDQSRKCPKDFKKLQQSLPLIVDTVAARGKIIYITLTTKNKSKWFCLWCAFAMTGKFILHDQEKSKHDKYLFRFKGTKILKAGLTPTGLNLIKETTYYTPANNFIIPKSLNGKQEFNLYFESVRGFSKIELLQTPKELSKKLDGLKYSFLQDPDLSLQTFHDIINHYPNRNISSLLLDAHIFSGIGNYILAESLYKAKISPFRKISTLDKSEINRLYKALQYIFKWSYLSQGGTNHNIFPKIKVPSKEFTFAVYRQDYDPKGHKVIHEKIPSGRTGHWVKQIQI
jgi:formamidopyrimidine-DNA glycosylase